MTQKAEKGGVEAGAKPSARHVRYVVNRPYSAGEAPEVVTARVVKEYEGDADVLDLALPSGKRGVKAVEVAAAHRCERQAPGTWFEGGE